MVLTILACKYDPDIDEVVFVSDSEAEFYGVYQVNPDNSLTHRIDCATESDAERYAARLKIAH